MACKGIASVFKSPCGVGKVMFLSGGNSKQGDNESDDEQRLLALHLRMEERLPYTKIEEVRMKASQCEEGPLVWPSITIEGVTRLKEYTELTPAEAIQADCDIKVINIILQGLPTEIYALVSQHRVVKDLWEKIKLLMQGTSLTKQERECKLYDEFDKFTYKKGELLHEY
ncbi:hypothetical protein Tco_0948522 [Tanacetum coccineum]